jgi:hypothetical protein
MRITKTAEGREARAGYRRMDEIERLIRQAA